jgi:uncharacterized membrane protein
MALGDYETTFRFLHVLAGITWVGLLYFFNFVNAPLLKFQLKSPVHVAMGDKASAHVALKALFWFRWGAMFTLIFGLLLVGVFMEYFGGFSEYFLDRGWQGYFILTGVVLGIIMWFNVWFLIWPNQKVILANNLRIAAGATDDEKAQLNAENAPRLKVAMNASRFNTWASVPMLFGMVFGAHSKGFVGGDPADILTYAVEVVVLAGVLAIMIFLANRTGK